MSDEPTFPPPPPPSNVPPPPSYPPPPAPSYSGGGGGGAPRVRIGEWFQESWAVVQPVWLECLLAGLVYSLVVAVATIACLLPGLIIAGPMIAGMFVYMAKRLLGQPAEIGDIFKGFRRFGPTATLGVIYVLIPMLVGAILFVPYFVGMAGMGSGDDAAGAAGGALGCFSCSLGMLFIVLYPLLVGTFCIFAFPLVLFRNQAPMDAIKASIAIVKPQFVNFLLLLLACMVVAAIASAVPLLSLGLSPLASMVVVGMMLLAYKDFVGLTADQLAPYGD